MSLFKKTVSILILSLFVSKGAFANDPREDRDLMGFITLLEEYKSLLVSHGGGEKDLDELLVTQLTDIGRSAALYFFDNASRNGVLGERMLSALAATLKENPQWSEEFIFLGNAFVDVSREIASSAGYQPSGSSSKNNYSSIILGSVAGIVIFSIGGIVLKVPAWGTVLFGAFGGIAGGAVGESLSPKVVLRADPRVKTAEEFNRRFPSGTDLLAFDPDAPKKLAHLDGDLRELSLLESALEGRP